MEKIEISEFNKDYFELLFEENNYYFGISEFNEPYISYRICNTILCKLNIETSLILLMKLTSSRIFKGINEILLNDQGEELSLQESIEICVKFINTVVLNINNDYSNLSKEIIENFNN